MDSHPNQEKAVWQGAERRRSTRLAATIPITLKGKDATGREFKERTRAVAFNNHGARIPTAHQLSLGSEVIIENSAAGLAAPANVVWAGERRSPKDPFEVGIQLVKPGNVWGIEFPPENWQECAGAPAASAAASAPARPEAASVAVAAVAAPLPSAPEPAPASALPASEPSLPGSDIQAVLTWLASRADEIKETQARAFEERLNKVAFAAGVQAQTLIQDSVAAAAANIQPELERQLEPVSEKLRASRVEFEALLNQVGELQRRAEETQAKTLVDAEGAAGRVQTLQQNLQSDAAVLESRLGEIRASVQAAAEAQIQENTRAAVETAVARVQEASREAAGFAREELFSVLRQNLQAESVAATEQYRSRVQEETALAMEAGRKQTAEQLSGLLPELQSKVQAGLQSALGQLLEQSRAQVTQAVEPLTAEIAQRLRKSAEDAAGGLRADLEAALEKARGQFVEQLAMSVKEAQEASRQQLRQDAAEVLTGLRGELRSAVKSLADEARANLAALARNTVDAMNREGQSGLEQYRNFLRKGLQEHADRGARELSAQFERSLESRRSTLEAQLQKAADEASAQAMVSVRTSVAQLLKEAAQTLNQEKAEWEGIRGSAAEAREQAIAQVRAAGDQSVAEASEALKKRTLDASAGLRELNEKIDTRLQTIPLQVEQQAKAALEIVHQQTDATVASALARFIEQVQARLKDSERSFGQTLRDSEPRIWEMLQPRVQKISDEMLAASAAQLRKQNEDMSAAFAEQLKEKQQQAADAAVEAFRSKISEMLAIFQMGAKK